MDACSNRSPRSPVIGLLTGFSAGVVLVLLIVVLALGSEVFTGKQDPIFDALTGPPGLADFSAPGLAPPKTDTPKVASLRELLPRLEAKVATNADDADMQILLARTYLELDETKKAGELSLKLRAQFPQNEHLPFLRAKILMRSNTTSDLKEAISLFEESSHRRPATAHLARLHQGQILVRLDNRKQAIKIWRDFISRLPADDERRKPLEAELEKAIRDHQPEGPS